MAEVADMLRPVEEARSKGQSHREVDGSFLDLKVAVVTRIADRERRAAERHHATLSASRRGARA